MIDLLDLEISLATGRTAPEIAIEMKRKEEDVRRKMHELGLREKDCSEG